VTYLKPPALRPGDVVSVIAPAGPFRQDLFQAGVNVLSERYQVRMEESITAATRYLAGDRERRQNELNNALKDPHSKAIFTARGGYGAMHLLPRLNLSRLTPKPLVGFSDITALHGAAQSASWVSLHAPVLTQLGNQSSDVKNRFFEWLERSDAPAPLMGKDCYVPGNAEGVLLGGNLSVFAALLGTPYMPNLEGSVLLLEDVGERPYRLDRLWTQLELAGVFSKISGIVLGDFTGCEEPSSNYTSNDVLSELALRTKLPCAAGFQIGHGDVNFPVALGARVRLEAKEKRLVFLEGAVRPEGRV
jgi:muramoyltetrapeptide carboxypeptidase